MSLRNIINEIAADTGISVDVIQDRAWLLDKINKAAEEIYFSEDLDGNSLEEEVFYIDDLQEAQITLPHYVGKVRAFRWYNISGSIKLEDLRRRYQTTGWPEADKLPFRVKRVSTCCKDFTNLGKLRFLLPKAETADVTINVVGTTDIASRISESVTIPAGSLHGDTLHNYVTAPDNIEKSALNTYDISVVDIEGNEVSLIPSSSLSPSFIVCDVLDAGFVQSQYRQTIECLFKAKFIPFRTDYDVFQAGNRFDNAIYWKFREIYHSLKKDGLEQSKFEFLKSQQLVQQSLADNDKGKTMMLDFAPNKIITAHDMRRQFWRGSR